MTLAIANEALSEPSRKCGSQVPVSVGRRPFMWTEDEGCVISAYDSAPNRWRASNF